MPAAEYIAARRVLLDALGALQEHLNNLIQTRDPATDPGNRVVSEHARRANSRGVRSQRFG
jgi:hypothetical protein